MAVAVPAGSPELLERDELLAALRVAVDGARAGSGCLVLVSGEAGAGKSALVRLLCADVEGRATVLAGGCDALLTPRPLGPIHEIEGASRMVGAVIEAGAHEIATTLLGVGRGRQPLVLVLEDVHWADEATLDVLRALGRRIGDSAAVAIATYRDDQLDRRHPLRVALGDLATIPATRRIAVPPLSLGAVAELARSSRLDANALYRLTSGNPFYVTELLASGRADVPDTVRDIVLARVARLDARAIDLAEAVSVAPPMVDAALALAVCGDAARGVDDCVSAGVLRIVDDGVAFRHELARVAVEESLSPTRRLELHRATLRALSDRTRGSFDLARLAHHAEGAADAAAVLRYAPAAAEQATSVGSHREAAAQYARALRFADRLPELDRADLLERMSAALYETDEQPGAIAALERAIGYRRRAGDRRGEVAALSRLVPQLLCVGRLGDAERAVSDAITLAEAFADGGASAAACGALATLHLNCDELDEAIEVGRRAAAAAREAEDGALLVDALTTAGTAAMLRDGAAARGTLEQALECALGAGVGLPRIYNNLVVGACDHRAHDIVERYADEGLAYCDSRDLDLWRLSIVCWRLRSRVDQGRWDEAVAEAMLVLADPRSSAGPRADATLTVARVRTRRGDIDAADALRDLTAMRLPEVLAWLGPIAATAAEHAWIEGRGAVDVRRVTQPALELALERRASWVVGELAFWRQRVGLDDDLAAYAAEPYARALTGDWHGAAALWDELGCPYEAAIALSEASDGLALRDALERFRRLGARPAAARVARRLRRGGERNVPRGPRRATRGNAAGLTPREVEVLEHLAAGLRNRDIALRLSVSTRTVDHHVSTILRKLDVRTRGAAVAAAAGLGLPEGR